MEELVDKNFLVQHTIVLPRTSKLTEKAIQELDGILSFAKPDEYGNTLIEIYHMYIAYEYRSLPGNFDAMADHMYFLIDFKKKINEEMGVTKNC